MMHDQKHYYHGHVIPCLADGPALLKRLERAVRRVPRHQYSKLEIWGLLTDTTNLIVNGWDETLQDTIMVKVKFNQWREEYTVIADLMPPINCMH